MSATTPPILAAFAIGYVLGSIPFGLLLTRAAGLGDIRNVGSGNIGATNVLRTGNKGLAAATLFLDALKATVAVVAAAVIVPRYFAGASPAEVPDVGRLMLLVSAPWAAAIGALCGHVYPVWLGFRGGKGVATYLGALIGVNWIAAVVFAAAWLATAAVSRISSLSALVGLAAVMLYFLVFHGQATIHLVAIALMTALVAFKHSANIARLLRGEEPKIGAKG